MFKIVQMLVVRMAYVGVDIELAVLQMVIVLGVQVVLTTIASLHPAELGTKQMCVVKMF